MDIFVDSDVVISSLLSSSGAAYLLLHHRKINPIISSYSQKELTVVVKRMGISESKLKALVGSRLKLINIKKELKTIKQQYREYVTDINDAHIVAGAHVAKVGFLITYNLKHFRIEKIKNDFAILVMTPALFLQYLRSR